MKVKELTKKEFLLEGGPQMAQGAMPKSSFKKAIDEVLLGVKSDDNDKKEN